MANVLVVGGGGREHALVWKLCQSPNVEKIWCAPGNGGIADLAECVNISARDIDGITRFAEEQQVDMVVVGPDDPLAMGLVDGLSSRGIRAFGPKKAAARLEWSKSFAKDMMRKYGVPTAAYKVFTGADEALAALDVPISRGGFGMPLVIKADGLALGKGVIIARTGDEAEDAIKKIMLDRVFGDSGGSVVLEECLEGPEVTILAFTDGKTILPMMSSQDHKRAKDGDLGPNTGGMGVIAPSPKYTDEIARLCEERVFRPTLRMIREEGLDYRGVLYFGLMLTKDGPKVIEYNARFGDPETQAILPLLKNDLYEIFAATADGRLSELELRWEDACSVSLVLASGGYPEKYETGYKIEFQDGLSNTVFHAGTRRLEDGSVVTAGGRVLNVSGLGQTLAKAADDAYAAVRYISFKDMYYRNDIGGVRNSEKGGHYGGA